MKIKPILANMSGRLQGIVASHNRGGQYFRGRTIPDAPPTAPQTAARLIMSNLIGLWKTDLDNTQRGVWNDYAQVHPQIDGFGDSVNIGGVGYWVRQNFGRLLAGLAVIPEPPVDTGPAFLTAPSVERSGAAQAEVTFEDTDPWADTANGALLMFASKAVAPSRYSAAGIPLQFVGAVLGGTPTNPATVDLPWAWTDDARMFWRFYCVDPDGRVSPSFHINAIGV